MRNFGLLCCLAALSCHSHLFAMTVTVDSGSDPTPAPPPTSLRVAIETTNLSGDLTNTINFDSAFVPQNTSILLIAPLPTVTTPLLIDGTAIAGIEVNKALPTATYPILHIGAATTTLQDIIFTGGSFVIDSNATLAFDYSSDTLISDQITGSGSLAKQGAATLTLGGGALPNSWLGGTHVQSGILRGDVASLPGNITIDVGTTLTFTAFDSGLAAQTFSGDISGNGQVIKEKGHDLTLAGATTYLGGTTVSAGRLIVDPSTFGSATTVASGAHLTLHTNAVSTVPYTAPVSGAGALEKSGSGTVELQGLYTYTGGTLVSGGVLRGTVSTLLGSFVVNSGTDLNFSQPAGPAGTFSGSISGAGGVILDGPGTLIIATPQSYTGTTTINSGTLDLQASLAGNVVTGAGSSLAFDYPTAQAFAGNISGSGSVIKNQAADLTLTGTDSVLGGTFVTAGRLIVDPAKLTSNTDIAAGTFLRLDSNSSTPVSFTPVVTGSGVLEKTGTSTVNLLGISSYTGGTDVIAGTLQGKTSTLQGNYTVSSGATLEITEPGTGTLNAIISGAGQVLVDGVGKVTFNTPHSYTGGTSLNNGTLILESQLPGNITTASGSTLMGPGSIAGNLSASGTVCPDPAYGSLVVDGNASLASSNILNIAVDPTGLNSALVVNGTTAINGATVHVTPAPGIYDKMVFDIVQADGGFDVTHNTFATPTGNTIFLNVELQTVLTDRVVRMTFTQLPVGLSHFARTPNQVATAAAFDELLTSSNAKVINVYNNLATGTTKDVDGTDDADDTNDSSSNEASEGLLHPREIIDSVGGETLAGLLHPRLVTIQRLNRAIGQRFSLCRPTNPDAYPQGSLKSGAWFEGIGGWDSFDGCEEALDVDATLYGITAGVDHLVFGNCEPCRHNLRLGVAGSYTYLRSECGDELSRLKSQGAHVSGFAAYQFCWFYLGAIGNYSYDWSHTERKIKFAAIKQNPVGRTGGPGHGGHVESGVRLPIFDWFFLQPDVAYDAIHVSQRGFKEHAGGPFTLKIHKLKARSSLLSTRTSLSVPVFLADGFELEPLVYAGWSKEYAERRPVIHGEFVCAPDGSGGFRVHGPDYPHKAVLFGARVMHSYGGAPIFIVSYDGSHSHRCWTHDLIFTVTVGW